VTPWALPSMPARIPPTSEFSRSATVATTNSQTSGMANPAWGAQRDEGEHRKHHPCHVAVGNLIAQGVRYDEPGSLGGEHLEAGDHLRLGDG